MNYCNTRACRIAGFLMLLFGFRVSSGGQLNCHFGSFDQSKGTPNQSLVQQTCSVKYLHQFNLTDGSSINISYSLINTEVHNVSSEDLKFCLVFVHQNSNSDHSCDHDRICQTNGVHQKFLYKGQLGTLFCCQTDLCNTYDRAVEGTNQSLNTYDRAVEGTNQSLICYVESGLDYVCIRSRCMNQTTVALNGSMQYKFSCANESNYDPNLPVNDECHETIFSTGRTTTCFCKGNRCNRPAVYLHSPTTPLMTTPAVLLYVTQPTVHQGQTRNWGFIVTVAAVVLLVVLVLALVVFVVRRFREHRTQHLTYTYTQLTADLTEERDTEDEYMLIG